MSTKSDEVLSVKGLSISFRSGNNWNEVVRDVSFEVKRGQTLGIVGESGSGKTVSSMACMGLLPSKISRVDNGCITFGKEQVDLLEEAPAMRGHKITMIFQEPMTSLNPSMRCGEQVAESLRLHQGMSKQSAKEKVIALFKEVELPSPEVTYAKYPHELSGGQKQRIVIAMALAVNPELVFADEPTTALDVTVQESILKLLAKLKASRGLSMVFISHDLRLVSRVADEVVVMWKGKVMEKGSVDEVLKNPKELYTKGLLACEIPTEGDRKRLPTVHETVEGKAVPDVTFLSKTGDPLLHVKDLRKAFPTKTNLLGKVTEAFEAVKGVSFDLKEGETLGIVGESGCGKSTVSRLLMNLIDPTSGEITWKYGEGRAVQLVFQDPYSSLNPRQTAGTALIEALQRHQPTLNSDERVKLAKSLLHEVGLVDESFERYPHSFSGGQRQRLVIARALCTNPKVLILDESIAALDISIQAQVMNLLNELKEQRNLSFIFISHDLNAVRFMSDRILVMKEGLIVEEGASKALFQNPKQPYTQKLLKAALQLD